MILIQSVNPKGIRRGEGDQEGAPERDEEKRGMVKRVIDGTPHPPFHWIGRGVIRNCER